MVQLSNIVLAASVAAGAMGAALPAGPKVGTTVNEKSFSVKSRAKPVHDFAGPLATYKTYLKFGIPVPAELAETVRQWKTSQAIEKRASGTVTATPIDTYDDAYDEPVSIGTPAQTLDLDFDTGSSDLWVFSTLQPSSQIQGQTAYNPSKSSSAVALSGYTWSISYGDGSSSSGVVYNDTVTIGGLTVTNQEVEAAKTVSSSFVSDASTDGLVGLAFDNLNTVSPKKAKTWFTNVKPQLDSPLFTADLKHQAVGTYTFGAIETAKYTGSITYVSVSTSPGYWTFSSSGYKIGSAAFSKTTISGIADTGTTLLYLPTSIVTAYYKQVSGSSNSATYGGYIFKCTATLPTFTFGVGSAWITIPANYLNYGPVSTGSSTCYGGLQSSSGIGINIFGDVALKAAYVVFNGASTPTLGWANKTLTS